MSEVKAQCDPLSHILRTSYRTFCAMARGVPMAAAVMAMHSVMKILRIMVGQFCGFPVLPPPQYLFAARPERSCSAVCRVALRLKKAEHRSLRRCSANVVIFCLIVMSESKFYCRSNVFLLWPTFLCGFSSDSSVSVPLWGCRSDDHATVPDGFRQAVIDPPRQAGWSCA